MHHLGQRDDIEYRHPELFLNGVSKWHQVGAFDNQRAKVRSSRRPAATGLGEHFAPEPVHIQLVPAAFEHDLAELRLTRHPGHADRDRVAADRREVPRWSATPALATSRPTRWSGRSIRATIGSWIRLDAYSGTSTAAASCRWNSTRKPHPLVIAATPRACKFPGRRDERLEQGRVALADDPLRGRAGHDLVA